MGGRSIRTRWLRCRSSVTGNLPLLLCTAVIVCAWGTEAGAGKSRCVDIDVPSKLLACYNTLDAERRAKKSAASAKKKSAYVLVKSNTDTGWQLTADGLSDAGWERLNLRLYSRHLWIRSDDVREAAHLTDLRPSIWIQCINGRMSGYIDWGIYLDVAKAKIVFRFDKEAVQTEFAKVSEDHKKIEPISEAKLILRIKEMFGRERLMARVTPLDEKPLVVTFRIAGLMNAIKPLRKSCNW